MTPFQCFIIGGGFVSIFLMGHTIISETKAIREELAQIKNFQQAKVSAAS